MAQHDARRWALAGFVLTTVWGQLLSVGFEATLRSALISLFVFYVLGIIGSLLWREAFE